MSQVLDIRSLNRLRRLASRSRSGRFLGRLIDMFVEDTELRLVVLRQAAAGGDDHVLRTTAHAIRGGAATLGAFEMVPLSSQLEELPAAWTCEDALQIVAALAGAFERARVALARFVADSDEPSHPGAAPQ